MEQMGDMSSSNVTSSIVNPVRKPSSSSPKVVNTWWLEAFEDESGLASDPVVVSWFPLGVGVE